MKQFDIVILGFLAFPFVLLSFIQIRKQFKYGYYKALGQKLDALDKALLKVAGISFVISAFLFLFKIYFLPIITEG